MTVDWASFLPVLAGGALIGLAAGSLRLLTGRIAGISGIVHGALRRPERGWQLALLAGLLVAGLIAGMSGLASTEGLANTSFARLAIAGLLVGLGTGLSNGCTSGHGICGLANFSCRSLAAVCTFMVTGIATVFVVRHGIGGWRCRA